MPLVEPDTSQRTACPEGTGRDRGRSGGVGSWGAVAAEQIGNEEEQTSGNLQEPEWWWCACMRCGGGLKMNCDELFVGH